MEVERFAHEFGFKIFFLYQDINNLGGKFSVKKTLVGSYSLVVIA